RQPPHHRGAPRTPTPTHAVLMPHSLVARCTLLVLALVAGCDWAEDDSPAWTRVGASVYYDYAPRPDSLYDLPPRAPIPPKRNAVRMRVEPAPDWSDGERLMVWDAPGFPDAVSPFYGEVFFPMENEDLVVTDRGLEVVIPYRCHNGLSYGWTSWVRVPREPADVRRYAPCSLSPGELHRFAGIETVATPAGTFDT